MGNEIDNAAFDKFMGLRLRNTRLELINKGFTTEHAEVILEWANTLPIHVSASNVHAYIENGVVYVKPNIEGNSGHPKG